MEEDGNAKENVWFKRISVSIGLDDDGKVSVSDLGPEIPKRKVIVEKYRVEEFELTPGFSGIASVYGEDGIRNANAEGTGHLEIYV